MTLKELAWMAEGKQELMWDVSNNVMAAVINGSHGICSTIVKMHGQKPRPYKPIEFIKLNPYRA